VQPDKNNGKSKPFVQDSKLHWWVSERSLPKPLVTADVDDKKWYDELSILDEDQERHALPAHYIDEICTIVEKVYNEEVEHYMQAKKKSKSSDDKWFDDVIKSGTLSDKIAALSLRVTESPVHHLQTLDMLITMALKKEQRVSQMALEALKDLLIAQLLPDRRLKSFKKNSLGHPKLSMRSALLLWFESQLISRVEKVVQALEFGLSSNVEYYKKICMELAVDMIKHKPEQEARILTLVVNKLGDPKGKVCTKCVTLLLDLIKQHPNMRIVVIKEVRQLIYHPHVAARTLYNGIIFLAQIPVSQRSHDVCEQLLDTYLGLFENIITRDELRSRLLAALLNGINKSYPFLRSTESLNKHLDSLFRIVHMSTFSTSTQALMLISHMVLSEAASDKSDNKEKEQKTDDSLSNRFYRALYAKLLADEIITRGKNTIFLNLLYRSMKHDRSDSRTIAFIKRLTVCALQSSAGITGGILLLISEVFKAKPHLLNIVTQVETSVEGDAPQDEAEDEDGDDNSYNFLGCYDGSKREPEYAVRGKPLLWELSLLQAHYHPSIKVFNNAIVTEPHSISYSGDPITDFSLTAFLNRFSYKNPKKYSGKSKVTRSVAQQEEPINSVVMSLQEGGDAPDNSADKQFFYKFFGEREKLRSDGKSRDRKAKKRRAKSAEDNIEGDYDGSSDSEVDSDAKSDLNSDIDEAEIDKFADKLARDMIKSTSNNYDKADIDDDYSEEGDDFNEDDDDDDDGDDDDDDFGNDDDEDDDEGSGYDSDDYMGTKKKKGKSSRDASSDDSSSDDDYELMAYGDDAMDTDNQQSTNKAEKRKSSSKAKSENKKQKKAASSDFASAEDYEELMENIVQKVVKRK
jgi:ribosome biogenesis protein MAK21